MNESTTVLLDQKQDASLEAQHILSISETIINEVSKNLAGLSYRDRVIQDLEKQLDNPQKELSSATESDINLSDAIRHGVPRQGYLHLLLNRLKNEDQISDGISNKTIGLFREGDDEYKKKIYQHLTQLHPSSIKEGKSMTEEIQRIYRFLEKEANEKKIPKLLAVSEFYESLVLMKRFSETRDAVSFVEDAGNSPEWVTKAKTVSEEERRQSLSVATSLVPRLKEGDVIVIKGLFGVEDEFTVRKNNKVSKVLMTENEEGVQRNFRYRSPGALEGSMSDVLRVTKYNAGKKEETKTIYIPGIQKHIDDAANSEEAISADWAAKQRRRRAA